MSDNVSIYDMFFSIIKSTVVNEVDANVNKTQITKDEILKMMTIAKKHDISFLYSLV